MKLNKKKLFVAAIAMSLIAIISIGTLAWFNATDDVTNTFKVATNENDTDPTFSVEVSETDLDGNKTLDGVTYYDVLPGDVIDKNPTIKNTGDYTQWIRASVTMSKADKWFANGGSLKFGDVFAGSTYDVVANAATSTANWLLVEETATPNANGEAVWYLYLNSELAADAEAVLFETVKIDEDFTLEEVMALGVDGEFNITVKADALQKDNTGANAVEAFTTVGWTAGTAYVDADN